MTLYSRSKRRQRTAKQRCVRPPSITRTSLAAFLNDSKTVVGQDLKHLGIEVDELRLHLHTHLVGLRVLEVQRKAEGDLLVIALKRADGTVLRDDLDNIVLEEGDALIVVGRIRKLPTVLSSEVDQSRLL